MTVLALQRRLKSLGYDVATHAGWILTTRRC